MAFSELAIYISFISMKSKKGLSGSSSVSTSKADCLENVKEAREKEKVAML